MPWLARRKKEDLQYWLRSTTIPMLVSLPDGGILWANEAYENLTGYTLIELEKLTWTELTDDVDDRENDLRMANELVNGDRTSYQFRKEYRHKTKAAVPVMIHVLRVPEAGEFECFFVSVLPLDEHYSQAVIQVGLLHNQVAEIRELVLMHIKNSGWWNGVKRWTIENPKVAYPVWAIVAVYIFGDRLLHALKEVMAVLGVLDSSQLPPSP